MEDRVWVSSPTVLSLPLCSPDLFSLCFGLSFSHSRAISLSRLPCSLLGEEQEEQGGKEESGKREKKERKRRRKEEQLGFSPSALLSLSTLSLTLSPFVSLHLAVSHSLTQFPLSLKLKRVRKE